MRLLPGSGYFLLDPATRVILTETDDAELRGVAERWLQEVRSQTTLPLRIASEAEDRHRPNAILLQLDRPACRGDEEGYRLVVDRRRVLLEAGSPVGIFYGLQTLGQLLPTRHGSGSSGRGPSWRIPSVEIEDAPRFPYRGMHLDVGRHVFPVSFIRRYIDWMAAFKMNTFHWHLTEDQGGRLEVRRYPRLTEVGAFRAETMVEKNHDPYIGDGVPYGGYYTQADVRDIVAYAAERFVTIIPEIEMPGHSTAALAAYPELACTDGPFEVATRWGVFEDIYCPGERTFLFLEAVLEEVMELFPGEYIHIGGDEAPKRSWEESPLAQAVIRREGLADEQELQSYFIGRIEAFLNSRGRRLIGWDEILEGGLAPNATVMSWRGIAGGIEAAREGHDVIMTPTSHLYFDFYQGDPSQEPLAIGGYTPLERVYAFEPVPEELTTEEARHILGAQANVWTEYMKTTDYVEYMVYPRLLALAEVVWSPSEARDWAGFLARLSPRLARLDAAGVNYRIPDVSGLEHDRLTLDSHFTVELGTPLAEGEIRYTTDGSEATVASPRYTSPLRIQATDEGTSVAARIFLPDGRSSAVRRARFARARLHRAESPEPVDLRPGVTGERFQGAFGSVEDLRGLDPVESSVTEGLEVHHELEGNELGFRFAGLLRVPRDDVYTFHVSSEHGSRLYVDHRLVVDHDGFHGMVERVGDVALEAGLHPLEVWYFRGEGGGGLRVQISGERLSRSDIPEGWLYHR
jgi:hexosaminidase